MFHVRSSYCSLFSLGLLSCLFTACLDENRCGPNQKQVGMACQIIRDAEVDHRIVDGNHSADSATDAATETTDSAGTATCAHVPTESEIIKTFEQKTIIGTSTCTSLETLRQGKPFDATVTISKEGDHFNASVITAVATISGTFAINTEGTATLTAAGDVLGMTFSANETFCFKDAVSGSVVINVELSSNGTPLCEFESSGTFQAK